MQLVSRGALLRIAVGLLALALLAVACRSTLCDCGSTRHPMTNVPTISADHLRRHVEFLAGELGEHNVFHPEKLRQAADYIERVWTAQGYRVVRLPYMAEGIECHNLEVTLPGTTQSNEIVVIGAHYDSVMGTPGANDNGSGVAALLELSRHFTNAARTVRFVAFVNEEPPFFQTELMGSRVYAKLCRERGDDIRAMISLETIGFFSDEPGSQQFPTPLFKLMFPDKGNFVAFVSNQKSRGMMRRAAAGFRGATDFPVECLAGIASIAGVGWSDHASFWHEGFPGVMVTDTAPFRYPYYHTPEDTPDKVNYPALARVTQGVFGALTVLAND